MKIDTNSPSAIPLPSSPAAKQVSSGAVSVPQSALADRTTFHSDNMSVDTLTSHAMSSPEVRQDKVDVLRQSVISGQYKPDATKTASAIVENSGGV